MKLWQKCDRRRRVFCIAGALVMLWGVTQGFAWLIAPSEQELRAEGRELFIHEWAPNDPLSGEGDGLGPVFNANSCVACHAQGGVGGAGENKHNVRAFSVLPNRNDSNLYGGVVHANATAEHLLETDEQVQRQFPIIPGGVTVIGNCQVRLEDFNPVEFEEINTPALFGAGLIDGISDWSIRKNAWGQSLTALGKEFQGDFDATMGKVRVLPDGRVGKFGWKAQFATVEEFVATACAVEVGLSNSYRRQDQPGKFKADENAEYDMTSRQFDSLTTFCLTLERPELIMPRDSREYSAIVRGRQVFSEIGCAECHTPDLGGVKGLYSDLCLHNISDPDHNGYVREPEVPMPSNVPGLADWKTPPLWGVADSAPYLHDGSSPTLEDAIEKHGGDAKHTREKYLKSISVTDRGNLIAFLKALRAPSNGNAIEQAVED
ncbi:MAG: c-type cytochrome [Planctomycetaceae bacterium]|nr:c-type cytochrome [Planctomycetaceae bacterium]